MELIDVIREPYLNKKRGSPSTNKFVLTFLVDRKANKVMIKKAFQSFFGVKALAVNTLVKKPKPARMTQKSRKNFTKAKKIAYVSLLREDFLNLKRSLEGDTELLEKELEEAMKEAEAQSSEPKSVDVQEEIKEVVEESVEEVKTEGETETIVEEEIKVEDKEETVVEEIKEEKIEEEQPVVEEKAEEPKE
ncbi:50S ribosomal protein L23 [Mycoplasma wenyonii str. Massachusetts]|uniref:Large ribosomal subunit protein uL23 n=1 Tax=Mycoplasma wenyonii (strain Massachusetts) TaxID=1197325 RepID=I6ZIV2_MYCWM|nr:50S ribosomal protein L23 [Mycoplasma wenyonii]AFN65130.1 50S ribosomal protein L23 [Mycoplasma wenyonii str. Massachusetts]